MSFNLLEYALQYKGILWVILDLIRNRKSQNAFSTRNQLRALPYYPFILFYCFESDYYNFLVQFSLHHLNMYRKVF
jgi:hypothetical protein